MHSSQSPLIIVVGHAALDSIYRIDRFPPQPSKVRALEHIESGGGSAANAAATIARLGGRVEFWCRLGDDDVGKRIRTGLAADGVGTSYVKLFEGVRSSQSAVIVDARGERLIISDPDHGVPPGIEWLPLADVARARAVLSDLRWFEGTRAAFEMARKHGAKTVVDIDVSAGALAAKYLPLTDYAIFSTLGLQAFAPGLSQEEGLGRALGYGVQHAGVTLGAEGYVWRTREGASGRQPGFAIKAADTTGAGDAFHGAFTWALVQGKDDAACARIGAAVAALKCRKLSARAGLPSRLEVEAFLAGVPANGVRA